MSTPWKVSQELTLSWLASLSQLRLREGECQPLVQRVRTEITQRWKKNLGQTQRTAPHRPAQVAQGKKYVNAQVAGGEKGKAANRLKRIFIRRNATPTHCTASSQIGESLAVGKGRHGRVLFFHLWVKLMCMTRISASLLSSFISN